MSFSFNLANPRTSLQIAHWASFFYQLWPKHKIEPHLKKESLLKFNVKLKPKLSHGQNISKAKADPKPKLIKIKTYFNKIDLKTTEKH